jgi:hypothetical protein
VDPPLTATPDEDVDARAAIWRAICLASEQLAHRCSVLVVPERSKAPVKVAEHGIPNVPTWQLVEGLSLLSILCRAENVISTNVVLLTRTGPIEFVEDRAKRCAWSQHRLQGGYSSLGSQPDLIITSTLDTPSAANVLRIIEVKSGRKLDAPLVRAEFGKAHDLRVRAYLIWTYYTQARRLVDGARGLGVEIEPIGFDGARRSDLVENPIALLSWISLVVERSKRDELFANRAAEANREIQQKLLGPAS